MTMKKYHLATLIAAINTATASPAIAASNNTASFTLEEVMVTARKREENVQDTPISISAFSANELKLRNISSTDQLGDITPNLTFDAFAPSSGSNASSQIYIRGIGQSDFSAVTDPGVGLYVDGVYFSRSIGGATDFLDLERIEVLRGPQGTLFGRNTIGGAISLHSRRPAETFGGSAEVEIGDDNKQNFLLDMDLPLSDELLSKISVSSRKRDGYVKRLQDGKKLGDDEALSARVALQWSPRDDFQLFATADYTKEREQGAPAVGLGVNDQQTFAMLANAFQSGCIAAPGPPGAARDTMNALGCLNDASARGPFENNGTAEVRSDLDYWGTSLEASWAINDWLSLKSITAYREMDSYSARDGDSTPFTLFHTTDQFDHNQFSQELQFSGGALEQSVKWLLGFYYFEEEADNPNDVALPTPGIGRFISGGKTDNENQAVFAQATWDLTESHHLTLGVRYTDETKRFQPYSFVPEGSSYDAGPGGFFNAGDSLMPRVWSELEFDDTTSMVNYSWDISDDAMIYATYSEGFKSGGFDQRFTAPPTGGVPSSFKPETATSYELGIKSSWLDNSLRLNMSAFTTDYEDMHIIVRTSFAPITFNAGESEIKGFELETSYIPNEAWIIQLSAGYIDARYTKLGEDVIAAGSLSTSTRFSQTPQWSTNLGLAYTTHLGELGTLTPRIDWSYKSESYNDAVNSEQLKQGAYHLVNVSLSYLSTDEKWEAVLSGRNINDELYLVSGISAYNNGASYSAGTYARESEWSLSAKYNF